ncbi:hypothetical protein DDQ41_00225 [Streptomyces spongiicola]|uniref:Uncharacterized protein n=1 Tax=Streptomyces spongiicola TaxID=1690221 RepID=A0ABN5K9U9_9ACTN|nr:hypothetical protein DDQ41_00225 [Streptomyces spongiicola]
MARPPPARRRHRRRHRARRPHRGARGAEDHPAHRLIRPPPHPEEGGPRRPRDARDIRDIRDARDVREARDARDARDVRDIREPRKPASPDAGVRSSPPAPGVRCVPETTHGGVRPAARPARGDRSRRLPGDGAGMRWRDRDLGIGRALPPEPPVPAGRAERA